MQSKPTIRGDDVRAEGEQGGSVPLKQLGVQDPGLTYVYVTYVYVTYVITASMSRILL